MSTPMTPATSKNTSRGVLVAGATGYLGGFVVRELAARGYRVKALARAPEKLAGVQDAVDEIAVAEVTRPETLTHVCEGVEVVFSSIGITRQADGLSFRDVDYQGNRNLLDAALRAGVKRFVYVSVLDGPDLRHLDIVEAHEAFVDELRAAAIDSAVLRPTGYFSDMTQFLDMARHGRVWLVGTGEHRVNPVHGADLAAVCADAIEGGGPEIDVGGPEILTWTEIAQLAFRALGKSPRVNRVPTWLMRSAVRLVRLFNRHQGELLAFFATMATRDVVAPAYGSHTLGAHFMTGIDNDL